MRYILNSAVITSYGTYVYEPMTVEEAKRWAKNGPFISTIGYEETAAVLSQLLQIPIQVNRTTIKMEVGDEALVFRIVLPPGSPRIDPQDKGRIANVISSNQWELGLLSRIRDRCEE
ncbi:MAG: DUF1874 domain-containing protein [Nitrososphaerota archaeon]